MSVLKSPQNGTNLLQTALAKPYHYRRSGRYYLRLRPQGATQGFFTLSLRTTDKATAMQISKDILKTLSLFHLDNPKASWRELKERLITIAEECLTMAHGDDSLVAYEMIYDELRLFTLGAGQFSGVLNGTLREVLGLKTDRTQTFHSLRHSLAGALKAAEVPVGTAESILGHSSGSISYDLYGAGSAVEVGRMAEALRAAFKMEAAQ